MTQHAETITVTVNGKAERLPAGASVAALLTHLKLDALPAAVEVNKRVVPKRLHDQVALQPNDVVEVVTLVGGG